MIPVPAGEIDVGEARISILLREKLLIFNEKYRGKREIKISFSIRSCQVRSPWGQFSPTSSAAAIIYLFWAADIHVLFKKARLFVFCSSMRSDEHEKKRLP